MGKHTGYDVEGNKYYPAPTHTDRMDELRVEEEAVHALLESVNSYADRRFREIHRQQKRWWDRVADDLGLDLVVNTARYNYSEKVITVKPEPQEDAPAAQEGGEA